MIKPFEVVVAALAVVTFIANAVLLGSTPLNYVCWAIAIVALIPGCVRWMRARGGKRRPQPSGDTVDPFTSR
ncbi:membrane protein implicated in regulation of membrane protease activity [Microbacterium dextranolyticum]|uniref:Uncharacterized protein n=1 Tax=Microbacterium dextranolyticum TaxID=36806 RepID=A0A9W6HLK3_9MICO|nr:membrane protein implicated in regulation of membrane protease activity [Microbacterium dextranolyticum]GLJ95273.1 hypothetical protein GCM10017591_13350 [Microbacterium dextranolyticum]